MTEPDFAPAADRLIARLRAAVQGLPAPAPTLIPDALGAPQTPPDANTLPVLDQSSAFVAHAPAVAVPALRDLAALAPRLHWSQTYAQPQVSADFLLNYGWTELAGPAAPPALYAAPEVSIGVLLLGPNTHYPTHQHEALEYYIPLSGEAEWFTEDTGWRRLKPLAVIEHRPWVKHAMQTRTEPMLALYRWSGPGVGGHARLT
jgi:hypothetical protein